MADAKEVKARIKLHIEGGKATPAPPVGPALGQAGINIMEFCKAYNAQTSDKMGTVIPVEITAYADATFDFVLKTPPASDMIRKALGIKKGASMPGRDRGLRIQRSKLVPIAETKMPDLNANDIEAATEIIAGSARSMGIEVI